MLGAYREYACAIIANYATPAEADQFAREMIEHEKAYAARIQREGLLNAATQAVSATRRQYFASSMQSGGIDFQSYGAPCVARWKPGASTGTTRFDLIFVDVAVRPDLVAELKDFILTEFEGDISGPDACLWFDLGEVVAGEPSNRIEWTVAHSFEGRSKAAA